VSKVKFKYLRSKSLKIVCSESDAHQIVDPLTAFTAIVFDMDRIDEFPAVQTMIDSMSTAKARLSTLMAVTLGRIVNPKKLVQLTAEIIPFGGYIKISVVENVSVVDEVILRQPWSITLRHRTKQPLSMLLYQIYVANNPDKTEEECVGVTSRMLDNM
jgi:hypothetical protein